MPQQLEPRDEDVVTAQPRADDRSTSVRSATGPGVPVLRIQDEALAYELYVDYLGFAVDWEHRYAPGAPVYLQVRRGTTVLHLSEHHGDGVPGTVVRIPVDDLRALHAELTARGHRRLRPGVDDDAPGGAVMEILDPFGNALRFHETPR